MPPPDSTSVQSTKQLSIYVISFFPTAYLELMKASIMSHPPIFPFIVARSFSFLPSLEGSINSF